MSSPRFADARAVVRRALQRIGYLRSNLRNDYSFADLLAASPSTETAGLAAFTSYPFTYASAAATLLAPGSDPRAIRSLGAPLVFEHRGDHLVQWKVTTSDAEPVAEHPLGAFEDAAIARQAEWDPDAIARTKLARLRLSPQQLDFVDIGLLPAIDAEARRKLDAVLQRAVAVGRTIAEEHVPTISLHRSGRGPFADRFPFRGRKAPGGSR